MNRPLFLALLFGGWGIIGIIIVLATEFPIVRWALFGIAALAVLYVGLQIDKGTRGGHRK